MARQEILLIKPVDGLGNEGENVTVKTGYARNYLLPRHLGIPFTKSNRKQMEALLKVREKRLQETLSAAEETAEKLRGLRLAIPVKTGPGGQLFGSVSAADLHVRITEEGIEVDRRKIILNAPLKSLGQHTTTIKLHPEVSVTIKFDVVSENPIAEKA
jgi:large subunit ribosomal protein L9